MADNISLVVQSKQQQSAWEIGSLADKVTYETHLMGAAGKLEVSFNGNSLSTQQVTLSPGDTIYLTTNDANGNTVVIFWGYIFTIKQNRWKEINVTAYDQLRYLQAVQSYVFTGMTAGQILQRMAGDFRLSLGTVEDTGYQIPTSIYENYTLFDIITDVLSQTNIQTVGDTGKFYIIYDDAGALCLRSVTEMTVPVLLGDGSLVTEYAFSEDIDSDTYNKIKLVKPNKKTGHADTYIATDEAGFATWGVLQKYETVNENLTDAQMRDQIRKYLTYYDRALKTLTIDALGVVGLRAGSLVFVSLNDLQDFTTPKVLMVDRVLHTWTQSDHQMNLDVRDLIDSAPVNGASVTKE